MVFGREFGLQEIKESSMYQLDWWWISFEDLSFSAFCGLLPFLHVKTKDIETIQGNMFRVFIEDCLLVLSWDVD